MAGGNRIRRLTVRRTPGSPARGTISAGGLVAPVALGRAGLSRGKREGDGATPVGTFRLVGGYYRADRVRWPATALPLTALTRAMGWCDDPADPNYNRPVDLPFPASHERLWRDDHLYDIVVVLDFNLNPIRRGKGSAIFLHLTEANFAPTAGCVAVSLPTMWRLLARVGPRTVIRIG